MRILSAAVCAALLTGTASMDITVNAVADETQPNSIIRFVPDSNNYLLIRDNNSECPTRYYYQIRQNSHGEPVAAILSVITEAEKISLPEYFTDVQNHHVVYKSVLMPGAINNENGPNLKQVTIPQGVTEIYANAFKDCSTIERIIISGDNYGVKTGTNVIESLKYVYTCPAILSTQAKRLTNKTDTVQYFTSFGNVSVAALQSGEQDNNYADRYITDISKTVTFKAIPSAIINKEQKNNLNYQFEVYNSSTNEWEMKASSSKSTYKTSFPDAGEHQVRITITDQNGFSASKILTVTAVSNQSRVYTVTKDGTKFLTDNTTDIPARQRISFTALTNSYCTAKLQYKRTDARRYIDMPGAITFAEGVSYDIKVTTTSKYGTSGSKIYTFIPA